METYRKHRRWRAYLDESGSCSNSNSPLLEFQMNPRTLNVTVTSGGSPHGGMPVSGRRMYHSRAPGVSAPPFHREFVPVGVPHCGHQLVHCLLTIVLDIREPPHFIVREAIPLPDSGFWVPAIGLWR
jgi:hypothetical protein